MEVDAGFPVSMSMGFYIGFSIISGDVFKTKHSLSSNMFDECQSFGWVNSNWGVIMLHFNVGQPSLSRLQ